MLYCDRNMEILNEYQNGISMVDTASKFLISECQVKVILMRFIRVINEHNSYYSENPITLGNLAALDKTLTSNIINSYFIDGIGDGEYSWLGPLRGRAYNAIRYKTNIKNKEELRKALINGDLVPSDSKGNGITNLGEKGFMEIILFAGIDYKDSFFYRSKKDKKLKNIDIYINLLKEQGYTVIPPVK